MEPIASNRRVLTWLCLCPFDPSTSTWKRAFFVISTIFLFASEVGAFISSIIFFVKNVSNDLEGSLYAVFQFVAFTGLIYMSIVAFILRKRINMFLGTLSTIYEESERANERNVFSWLSISFQLFSDSNLSSFRHFERANHKSELLWEYYAKFVLTGFPASTIGMSATSVLYCHLTGKGFNSKYLYFPYKFA